MQHFVTDVIDVRYVTKNRQSDLCLVLDFRQSVEAIGLVVADYIALVPVTAGVKGEAGGSYYTK